MSGGVMRPDMDTTAEELYRQAFALSRAGRQQEAEDRLRAAAGKGLPQACYTLALNRLQHKGSAAAAEACRWLEQGRCRDLAPAAQLLAVLRLGGWDGAPAPETALDILFSLAARGAPGFLRQIAMAALLELDEAAAIATAGRLLGEAARRGDILASLLHARLSSEGVLSRAEERPSIAAEALARLRMAGHPAAALAYREGGVAAPRPEPLSCALREEMEKLREPLARALASPPAVPAGEEVVGKQGYRVRVIRRIWPVAACDYVAAIALPLLRPSTVLDPVSGQMRLHPVRRSHHATLFPWDQDLVTWLLERRLTALVGQPPAHGEMLCVLQYPPGGEYRPHLDALTAEEGKSGEELKRSGQRTHTVLVRLAERFAGGETHFPVAELSFALAAGDALVFPNVDEKGKPDPRSLHAGLPVRDGVKWMATKWIRAQPYCW
ncbi:MAG: 2OG-Fe(II) oxygenase [Alphaproteobacteria bacterium]|nr:MAG: 2OG-Fe(II) oxygenase [Alphaproteobacteria bacterium]